VGRLVTVLLAALLVWMPMSAADAGRLKKSVVIGLAVGGGVAFALSASRSIGRPRILLISSAMAVAVGGAIFVTGMHFHNQGIVGIGTGGSRLQMPRLRYSLARGNREISLPLVSMRF
jgi:hypothetical protein